MAMHASVRPKLPQWLAARVAFPRNSRGGEGVPAGRLVGRPGRRLTHLAGAVRDRLPASVGGRLREPRVRRALAGVTAVIALAGGAMAGQSAYSGATPPTVVTARPGDSVWAIAKRYGVSMDQLAAANGLNLSQPLVIGRQLVIPGTGSSSPPPAPPPAPSSVSPPTPAPAPPLPSASTFCASGFDFGVPGELPHTLAANPALLALRPVFVQWGADYGLAPSYLESVAWIESGWQEGAISSAHAVGVGQLLPSTAKEVNQELGTNLSILSASDNIRMEAAYLAQLRGEFGDSLCLMTAAYNEGPFNLTHVGVYPVTQQYVRDVLYDQPRFE
jgi:N-acetylmuramoyl-L-alanine amidase